MHFLKKGPKNSGMGSLPPLIRAIPERKRFFPLMSSLRSGHDLKMKWKLLPNEIWAFWCLGMILRRESNWCLPSHLWNNGMLHFFCKNRYSFCFDLSLVFSLAICIDVVVAGGGGGDKTDAATCWNGLAPLSMFELFAFREGEGPFVFCFDHHLRHKHGRKKVNMMPFSFSSSLPL